jgi:hypothetical protein
MHDGVRSSFNVQENQLVLFYVQVYQAAVPGILLLAANLRGSPNHRTCSSQLNHFYLLTPFPFGSGPEEVTFQQLSTHGVQNVACQQ